MFKFSCMGLWPDGSSAYFQALFIWPASIHCSQPYKEKQNRYSSKPQDQFSNLFPLRTFPLSTAYKASLGNSWVMHQCHFVHTNTSSLYWRRYFFFLPYFAFLFLLTIEWCILPVDPSNMCVLYWLFFLLNVTTSIYLYQVSTQLVPKGDCINRIWL